MYSIHMDTFGTGSAEPARGNAERVLELIDNALGDFEDDADAGLIPPPADPGDGDPDDDGDGEDEPVSQPARHYSTGKLTIAQARIVDGWRRQLTVSDRKWHTLNHRPPASSSDCIAAAVIDLLEHAEPDHLALIRYSERMRNDLALERGHGFPIASTVSFYLPALYADRLDELLTSAYRQHGELLDTAAEQARIEHPGRGNASSSARRTRMLDLIGEYRIPFKVYKLPAGTLARMAIDRWARRSPATVVAAAVKHGSAHHEQQHRARHDMGVGDAHR